MVKSKQIKHDLKIDNIDQEIYKNHKYTEEEFVLDKDFNLESICPEENLNSKE